MDSDDCREGLEPQFLCHRPVTQNSTFMKTPLIGLLCVAAAVTALAEATLDFSNYKPGRGIETIDAPAFDTDGTTRLGDQFRGQLYVGLAANNLAPAGSAVAFRSHSGTNTGYIVAGGVVLPTSAPSIVFVELRAWQAVAGATYEAAVAAGGKAGKSAAITVTLTGLPNVPPSLTGLQSFSLNVGATESRPPVSSGFGATTPQNQPLLIPFPSLLQPIHDPDGDAVHIVSVGDVPIILGGQLFGMVELSTNGALVVSESARATYIPKQDFVGADRFSYIVGDPYGATSTVYAQIAVLPPGDQANAAQALTASAGGVTFSFAGLPGRTYEVQRAPSATGPWEKVGEMIIQPDGSGVFEDNAPLIGSGFYRTVLLPN